MKPMSEIKMQAKSYFHQRYSMCIGAGFLFILLTEFISSVNDILGDITSDQSWIELLFGKINIYNILGIVYVVLLLHYLTLIFIVPPMTVGYAQLCRRIYLNETVCVKDMVSEGFGNYWHNVGGILWMKLFIVLWSVLLIIPGIIKSLAYFMTPYILAEYPNVLPTQALKLSMRMTNGYKADIFIMYLSFIGWHIMSAITLGILSIFYVTPYYYTSMAGMYDELKKNALENGTIELEELELGYILNSEAYIQFKGLSSSDIGL